MIRTATTFAQIEAKIGLLVSFFLLLQYIDVLYWAVSHNKYSVRYLLLCKQANNEIITKKNAAKEYITSGK
jgi:hypothetical protein